MIEQIKSAINALKIVDKYGCAIGCDNCEKSVKLAIKALDKQIPKKPDYIGDGYSDGQLVYDTFICPSCDTHYEVDYDDYMYCPKCGQRLDLTEV